MYRITVMGNRDSVYGFTSLGLRPFPLIDPAEVGKKIKDLAESGHAVVYVTETPTARIEPETNHYRKADFPAVVPIPDISDNTRRGVLAVKRSVEQAVGLDIIFSGQ